MDARIGHARSSADAGEGIAAEGAVVPCRLRLGRACLGARDGDETAKRAAASLLSRSCAYGLHKDRKPCVARSAEARLEALFCLAHALLGQSHQP